MRRDANTMFANDHFGVAFDSFYDRRNGYGMFTNSLGGMLDWSITNEQPNNSWNGIWDARTGEFDEGWTVELRFPFRSFRFREGGTISGRCDPFTVVRLGVTLVPRPRLHKPPEIVPMLCTLEVMVFAIPIPPNDKRGIPRGHVES